MWKKKKEKQPLIVSKKDLTNLDFDLVKKLFGIIGDVDTIVLRENYTIEYEINEKEA